MLEKKNRKISIKRQCWLLGINRSSVYYVPKAESHENQAIMREIDKQYLKTPFFGARRMTEYLRRIGYCVNIKRTRRLMNLMGLRTIYCRPNLSKSAPEHKKYPYLLRNVPINAVNQVWSTDITYIPMQGGYMYLSAIIDWHSRYIIAWRLSNTLHLETNVELLKDSLQRGKPLIFNTDQGSQFTSDDFLNVLKANDIKISMDGRGRATDNIFIERFWRSLKYEDIYLHSYETGKELFEGIKRYIEFYNNSRPHQSLDYRTPKEVYLEGLSLENRAA